ncbi:hypothetical protein R5N98_11150 [Tenacibaculum maritimum]|nr:hypothetical protein [Tenacibaculum maritimum]MCD9583414.1 hypothetical protein [Tenacibaculum maritimum]MCD9637349.1 hypothetical protein [Tenacibaculum maritimum]CAA0150007.1 hypothetical protein DPIF89300162_10122 [Tenacibaculum maritimum]CAA0153101.1 hypothetical protein DPIF8902391_10222 [Tenacibaculum maritimum]CAA0169728.1 hypothetical protein CVI1001048_140012 [Tenacibaculum maritimum]
MANIMIDCKHKPIKSQVSISKDLYKAIFEGIKIKESINVVEFRYFDEDDDTELIYINSQYLIPHNITNNELLTLFDKEGNEIASTMRFFDGIIKMCKECFFEYLKRHELEIR